MKDFIRDEGKVRECMSNIGKMNVLEFMWYRKGLIRLALIDTVNGFHEGFSLVLTSVVGLVVLILLPITFPIAAFITIRNAKKKMALHEKYHSKPL